MRIERRKVGITKEKKAKKEGQKGGET